ncbi:histidine phosphatase family protein [Rhodobacteraceae bacterium XHP0102]|nr:histidine phosphatase family protein [Rhodobacteraceae bacterium XHP0102]
MRRSFPIYLMRHGETEWNKENRFQGWLDSALTPNGVAQAEAQGRLLRDMVNRQGYDRVTEFRTSPLGRAARTARLIARVNPDLPPLRADERLREVHMGQWQGLTRAEVQANWPVRFDTEAQVYRHSLLTQGGETRAQLHKRLTALIADLKGPALLVSHGVVIQTLRGMLRGFDAEQTAELGHAQGGVYVITANGGEISLGF